MEQYKAEKLAKAKAIPSGIHERWQSRIVAQRLAGRDGAEAYLARYGKGIMAPKLVDLARKAEEQGDAMMSARFWEEAYRMDTGKEPGLMVIAVAPEPKAEDGVWPFPSSLQPGKLVTMQPVDAPRPQIDYVEDPRYWGQPKVYGHRLVVFATEDRVWYQARSLNLQAAPSPLTDDALRRAAFKFGPFILDGEKYYVDCTGQERMTAAQAATVNVQNGRGYLPTPPSYAVFRCLFVDNENLTEWADSRRLTQAEIICGWLATHWPGTFVLLPTARTVEEKRALVERQRTEGREGEVWFQHEAPYRPGKGVKHDGELVTVRTKYRQSLDVVVTGLTPTDKAGRAFAAIEVAAFDDDGNLVDLGRVGTGFTQEQQREIVSAFARGSLVVEITTQGMTENTKVVHGSFSAIRVDKTPEECVL